MAKNELWFYSGVRYAKDGRYACYCDTPAKKRTVLLKNALVTLSRAGGTANEATPWNIRQDEIRVEWNDSSAINARAFMNSNYMIVHDMATGVYYCYYVDYIDTVQQFTDYSDGAIANIKNIGSQVIYRIGISLDYWQTFFFKMQNKISTHPDRPQYCAPHSTVSDTVNEVVVPSFDFMNVQRTNMNNILQDIGNVENRNFFRSLQLPTMYLGNNSIRNISIVEEADTPATQGFYVLLKLQISNKDSASLSTENRGTIWAVYAGAGGSSTLIKTIAWGTLRRLINNIITSTGIIGADYTFNTSRFGSLAGTLKRAQNYSLEAAYVIPYRFRALIADTLDTIGSDVGISLIPTNYDASNIHVYPLDIINIKAAGIRYLPGTSTEQIKTENPAVYFYFNDILSILNKVYPTLTSEKIQQILPYLKVGTTNDHFIPVTPSINGVQAVENNKIRPVVNPMTNNTSTPVFWISLSITPYSIKIELSNGINAINLTEDFKLPLRQVTDNSEIENAKQSAELNSISQGISLLTTSFGTAISFATGNVAGGIMGAAQIGQQAISFSNSLTNVPNYDKMKKSATVDPTPAETIFAVPLSIQVPENVKNDVVPDIVYSYDDEFTEVGIEVGAALYRTNQSLDNADNQPVGYIEAGMVLLNIPAEAGEVLEKRFREGVNFYYV